MPLTGMRVLALETRRGNEIAELIKRQGGIPFIAPSMREVPVEQNEDAFRFGERLFAGSFDMVVFLTGVGTRYLAKVLATRYPPDRFPEALRDVTVVARGPKPVAALREMGVPVTVTVPETNTWRELLKAIEGRPEKRIAVQEYGVSNTELLETLRSRGSEVTAVRVYEWDLPEDPAPLREAARLLADREFNVCLFTTSAQVHHLMRVAAELHIEDEVRRGLQHSFVASIGPTTTETLAEFGLTPDLEPSHPKMGFLVNEASRAVPEWIQRQVDSGV
jgi:uroporphyrinogen-III synthase